MLYCYNAGEFHCRIPLIISNHSDGRSLAEFYEIPYYQIPTDPAAEAADEEKQSELLERHSIELVVLAR